MADIAPQRLVGPRLTSDEAAALAASAGLHQMGVRPPLAHYFAGVWNRRSFIWNLSASRAYARNQGSYLGQAWAVLRPILDSVTFVIIFGFVFTGATEGIDNRAAFIVIGTFAYTLFQSVLMGAVTSIPTNLDLIRSHQFPRAVVPLSTALTETVLFGPIIVAMVVLTVVTGFLPDAEPAKPTWSWLLIPVASVLLAMFSAGLGLAFARLGAHAPDLANGLPFFLTLGRFASGVMFVLATMIGQDSWFRPLFLHQPVAVYLELFRAVFGNEESYPMSWQLWGEALAWAVGIFALGFIFFWRGEETYGRD
jgi:teichoic acid transport system permease protein